MSSTTRLDTVRLHWMLRALNAVERVAGAVLPRFTLEPDRLEARARRQTGLDDFGDPAYRAGLERMCAELKAHPMHLAGRLSARDHIVRGLRNRLLTVDACRRDPGLSAAPLIPPLLVVGLPRSGTTFLHRVLCHAPDALPPLHWQLLAPFPPVEGPDRRLEDGRALIEGIRRAAPGLDAKHYMNAEQPEECMMLLDASMVTLTYALLFPLDDYMRWHLDCDGVDDYRFWRDALVGFQRRAPDRRLTLKAPIHTAFLDAIWHHVPEAMVIHPHRDPAKVVGSLCSLFFTFRGLAVDTVDRPRLGQAMLDLCEGLMARNLASRAKHPDKRIVDVPYRRLVADPVGTVMGIYAAHGLPVSAALESSIAAGVAGAPQHAFGKHDYALEDFGLTADGVRDRMAGYIERFLPDGL